MANVALSVPTIVKDSPNHGGLRARTLGIMLHSTRGGTRQRAGESVDDWLQREYSGTISWCMNPSSDVGPHFIVGPREVCRLMDDDQFCWCQTVDNDEWIGIEIAQPSNQPPFTSFQKNATAEICARLCKKYGIPIRYIGRQTTPTVQVPGILGHEDSYAGYSRGKSDPGDQWIWPEFIALVQVKYDSLFGNEHLQASNQQLRDYYFQNAPTKGFGEPVAAWHDAQAYYLVTASTPKHPSGQWHISRSAMNWTIATVCWCHKPQVQ